MGLAFEQLGFNSPFLLAAALLLGVSFLLLTEPLNKPISVL